MIRRIIQIDEERCNGCGACAAACHEGAIEIRDGKARLAREDYCDGLGDCLPECPTGAIRFEEREAPAYDEAAVLAAKQKRAAQPREAHPGCPGAQPRGLARPAEEEERPAARSVSRLAQWPCQIRLAPVNAPYFDGADLLIAADCTAYAYAAVHEEFMKGRVTLIGCPKLDGVDYSQKLAEILRCNRIRSVTLLRMEVPCCGGLELAAKKALQKSGSGLGLRTVVISAGGAILQDGQAR